MDWNRRNPFCHPIFYTLLILLLAVSSVGASQAKFVILHTSDVHGNISAHPDPISKEDVKPLIGGYAILKQLKSNLIKNNPEARVLYFDSGDFFQGTPVVDRTRGEVMIKMLNLMETDAVTLGNHEFDYSFNNLKNQFKNAEFDILCSNVYEKKTSKIPDFTKPYKVFSHNGIKIGIIGIDTPETAMMSIEKNVREVEFKNPIPIVKKIVKQMKAAGIDYIVLLSHLGYDNDIKFANSVEGINLILGGHSHSLKKEIVYEGPWNTAIVHSGYHCEYASVITLEVAKDAEPKLSLDSKSLYLSDFGQDKEVLKVEDSYLSEIRKEMEQVIGKSEVNLFRGINGGESTLGSTIADAMREGTKADVAFINFGGVRQPLFKGDITVESVFKVQPFDNTVEILNMTGTELLDLIERSLSNPFEPMNDEDKQYAIDHFNTKAEGLRRLVGYNYGYLLPSNLKITFNPENEPMKRIEKLEFLDGQTLDVNKVIKLL